MATLTETVIDLADEHTTLYHVGAVKSTSPRRGGAATAPATSGPHAMPFGSEKAYCLLHRTIADAPTDFAQIHQAPGTLLGALNPVYVTKRDSQGWVSNKYWRRLIGNEVTQSYPDRAWQCILPIEAKIAPWIAFAGKAGWAFAVSPVPRVLLYPFGWSTWISLRIVGPHTLSDLADLLDHVFRGQPFQIRGSTATLALDQLFDLVAAGVRTDAFGGQLAGDIGSADRVLVSTVQAKHGGSPSLGALSPGDRVTLRHLIRPDAPPPASLADQHIFRLLPKSDLEYVLREDRKRFLWVEHLLAPVGRNHVWLRCYHNNTFRSLVHAGQLRALLEAFLVVKKPGASLKQLSATALDSLTSPRYSNASLRDYLLDPAVLKVIERVQPKPKP